MPKPKVCLAYSGGLDTSCILAWLLQKDYEVICFMADVGQQEDFPAARSKALKIGASACHIKDLRKEFVQETCIPAIQCTPSTKTSTSSAPRSRDPSSRARRSLSPRRRAVGL